MAVELSNSVQKLRGIGPKGAEALKKMDIYTCRDLLYHYPRGYEDKSEIVPVEELSSEVAKVAEVTITSEVRKIRVRSGRVIVQADAADDSGSVMLCFFNQEYMKNVLHRGEKYRVYGKITGGRFARDMVNPEVKRADDEFAGGIQPLYPLTEGIRQNDLRKAIRQVLDESIGNVTDSIPNGVRQEYNLATAKFALENIHFPTSEEALTMARKRLIFGEFFTLSAALSLKKGMRKAEETKGWDISPAKEFEKSLPFRLTNAQKRALEEILHDISSGNVMNRLVQGDVGSGKTAVAAAASFVAIQILRSLRRQLRPSDLLDQARRKAGDP
ncbi:MAG: hypothetical protein MJ141_02750 [Clostridia bacterium]|nr:hypothetical protein [Clostridia bacterium]